MCELRHTSAVVQKMQGGQKTPSIGDYLGPGHSVLGFWARSSFLIDELLIGKLSETVVVHGNAPYDRPGFLVGHVMRNRASLLCTKAPMRRIPNEVSGHQLTSTSVPLDEEGPQPLLARAS